MERHRIMVKEDREIWEDFKANVGRKLNREQFKVLCRLHSKYYNHKYYEPCSCNPRNIINWISDIDKKYTND